MITEPSWDDTLTGRSAGARGQRPIEGGRSDGDPRHRSAYPVDDVERRTDWRLSAWLVCAAASCAAVLLGTGWAVNAAPGDAPAASTAAPTARGRTLLAVLTDRRGAATAAALVGVSKGHATCLLTPRQLAVEVPGEGRVSLQRAVLRAHGDRSAAQALSGTLGVRVDDTWLLSGPRLADLVDGVGGVDVDPAVRIEKGEVTGGRTTTHLTGRRAATWAAVVPEGQRDDLRLARFYAVLGGVFARLPDDPEARDRKLRAVYVEKSTTLRRDRFVELISALHEPARRGTLDDQVLPTVAASRGRYGVDTAAYKSLLAGPLSHVAMPLGVVRVQLRPPPEGGELVAQAQKRLAAASLQVVDGDEQPSAMMAGVGDRTTITVAGDSDRAKAEGVRTALGLPQALIVVHDLVGDAADVVVQLGLDFRRALEAHSG